MYNYFDPAIQGLNFSIFCSLNSQKDVHNSYLLPYSAMESIIGVFDLMAIYIRDGDPYMDGRCNLVR